jgi:high-affinity iron transporter
VPVLSSFVIVLREGFEAFLIVAIVLAYLRKSHRTQLVPAVYWAIVASLAASACLGWVLYQGANVPLWEGVAGLVAIPFVVALVIHMWRAGPTLKRKMEHRLEETATSKPGVWAAVGVFAFTALMVTREGMETALMLFQVRSAQVVQGALLGLAAAGLMAWAWARYGHRINIRRFFQVTGIFLLLFVVQIAIYSLYELSEAGILTNEAVLRFHMATEPYSPYGIYGKWFPLLMVGVPATWLLLALVGERLRPAEQASGRSR